MLAPRLADLLEPVAVSGAAAHSVNILWNKRMVAAGQSKPIRVDGPFITSISSQSEADAAVDRTTLKLVQADEVAYDNVRAGNSPNAGLVHRWQCREFYIAVEDLIDLNRQ